ncbi:MAG: ribosome maturation factor RimM [Calditrichaceae bacterium]
MYVIGKVLKPQGRRGEVKAEIVTSFPEHFETLSTVFIHQSEEWIGYSVENARLTNNFVFIKLAGVDSINEAEQLRGEYLHIPEDDLNKLSENEYYIHDLIGMQVFDEENTLLGEIIDVELLPANVVYTLIGRRQILYSTCN